MPRRWATSHSSRTGSRTPLTFETWVSASTRVRGVRARSKMPTSSSTPDGAAGVATRFTVSPWRAARTSQAMLFGGVVLVPHHDLVARGEGEPALTTLLASLVLRTRAISSAVTPSCVAAASRDASSRGPNFARFGNEQSTSMSRVSARTRSAHRPRRGTEVRGRSSGRARRGTRTAGAPPPSTTRPGPVGPPPSARPSNGATAPPAARVCRNRRRVVSPRRRACVRPLVLPVMTVPLI